MSGEGFLDRWSRRKLAAHAAPPVETRIETRTETDPETAPVSPPEAGQAAPPADVPETLPPEELARLTPLDAFDADTDLAQFLRKGVPRAMRNAALRRKWLLNTAIRDHKDIAVDYAWDWNVPGGVPGDGGPLDRDKVARMVRDVLDHRPAVQTDVAAAVQQDAALQQDSAGGVSAGRAAAPMQPEGACAEPPRPVPGTGAPASQDSKTVPGSDPPSPGEAVQAAGHDPDEAADTSAGAHAVPATGASAALRRRHGGAAPV